MSQISPNFFNQHSSEIEQIIGALSNITSLPPEEIKPHLNQLLENLKKPKQDSSNSVSFSETFTHEEWSAEFHQWIDSHKNRNIPVLSEEVMTRENIYPDRW